MRDEKRNNMKSSIALMRRAGMRRWTSQRPGCIPRALYIDCGSLGLFGTRGETTHQSHWSRNLPRQGADEFDAGLGDDLAEAPGSGPTISTIFPEPRAASKRRQRRDARLRHRQ